MGNLEILGTKRYPLKYLCFMEDKWNLWVELLLSLWFFDRNESDWINVSQWVWDGGRKKGLTEIIYSFIPVSYWCQFVKHEDWNKVLVGKQCKSIKIVVKIITVSNSPKEWAIAMCRLSYIICCIWFNFVTIFHIGGKGQGQWNLSENWGFVPGLICWFPLL